MASYAPVLNRSRVNTMNRIKQILARIPDSGRSPEKVAHAFHVVVILVTGTSSARVLAVMRDDG